MKEVIIHYFVPKNHEELERLVKEIVGVKIIGSSHPCEMVYYGIFGNEYEFLQQGIDGSGESERSMERVWGWRTKKDSTRFDYDGVTFDSNRHIITYSPFSNMEGFEERKSLLELKKKWRKTN